MNLVKWFRKNRTKVMAVVVIVIMIGFIGGTALSYLLRSSTGMHQTIAYFADKRKITNYDRYIAQQELDTLRMLKIGDLLRSQPQDLRAILLAELLFSESRSSASLVNRIKQLIIRNQYRISDAQIRDFYKRSVPSDIYWLLLKNETELAGIRVPNSEAGKLLARIIPQLFQGQTYSQVIGSLVSRQGIPQKQVLATFGKLLAVLQYTNIVCSTENVTGSQLAHIVSRENETINAELVRFDSAFFAGTQKEPTEEKVVEHFNEYKMFFPGQVSQENPYGFGYKLPDRVRLEYIALETDNVIPIIEPPTQEESEEYYQRNRDQLFTEQVPADPNDPNSPMIDRTKSYAEVAADVGQRLFRSRINAKIEQILQEAKTLADAAIDKTASEIEQLTPEQLKQLAGDYQTIAEIQAEKYKVFLFRIEPGLQNSLDNAVVSDELRTEFENNENPLSQNASASIKEKGSKWLISDGSKTYAIRKEKDSLNVYYKIRLYVGKTGLLSAPDIQIDEHLSRLSVVGYGYEFVPLIRVVFSIDQLQDYELGLLSAQEPRMFESIGPAKDPSRQMTEDTSGQITALFRVIEAKRACEPESVDQTFSTATLKFQNSVQQEEQDVYSVREEVIEDLKRLSAMDQTEAKAQEFIDIAANDSWQSALDTFNKLYAQKLTKEKFRDPNVFKLDTMTGLRRIYSDQLNTFAAQRVGNPTARVFMTEVKAQRRFIDNLYSLIPEDSNKPPTLPLVMEFKPNMSFYCVKDLSIARLSQQEYDQIKTTRAYGQNQIQAQNLAIVHFNPANILKRMNFRSSKQDEKPTEASSSAQTKVTP
jgi:hypothetical protein